MVYNLSGRKALGSNLNREIGLRSMKVLASLNCPVVVRTVVLFSLLTSLVLVICVHKMDLAELIDLGMKLGYEGEGLREFVANERDRQEKKLEQVWNVIIGQYQFCLRLQKY